MEEKVYKSNKIALELLRRLKDAEVELESLKQYSESLKAKIPHHKSVKTDAIDAKLADFINNHPNPASIRVMFQRIKEGLYSFGSKKINLFLENNKLLVRVGGGFLSIEEFME